MKLKLPLLLTFVLLVSVPLSAQKYKSTEMSKVTRTYNGIEFSSEKTLIENLYEAPEFSIYTGFLNTFGDKIFTEEFMGTVFVILDTGIEKIIEESENSIFSDPTYQEFQLQYFIIPGRLDEYEIKKAVEKGGGTARFATLSGTYLQIRMIGDIMYLYASEESKAQIIATDFYHKHGFFHIVDGPVIPNIEKN